MLRIRPQLLNMVLTREMQYTCVNVRTLFLCGSPLDNQLKQTKTWSLLTLLTCAKTLHHNVCLDSILHFYFYIEF